MNFFFLLSLCTSLLHAHYDAIKCRPSTDRWKILTLRCLCEPCYLCTTDWTSPVRFNCRPKDHLNLEDGAKPATQAELNPKKWFLTKKEMTQSRNNISRNELSLYTDGNQVDGFVDGSSMLKSMYHDIYDTRSKDFVLHTGWCSNNVTFDPYQRQDTSFTTVWGDAAARGVNLLTLIWQNILVFPTQIKMAPFMNQVLPRIAPKGTMTQMVLDDRLGSLLATHHQKTLVVKRQGEVVAYVGGIDLCHSRWDTWKHKAKKKLRIKLKTAADMGSVDGWVDESQRLRGPVVRDVLHNFLQRWNDPITPTPRQGSVDFGKLKPEIPQIPWPLKSEDEIPENVGTHSVQIVRTFSCTAKHYKKFAPLGEFSLFQARLKAIRQAQNYIYIIDQYFIYQKELLEALLEVLPRLQKLVIFARTISSDVGTTGYEKFQFEQIKALKELRPNKVHIFTTKDPEIYIHSKTIVIDDTFIAVGSANWNSRSMASDSEIAAHVVDREYVPTPDGVHVGKYVRNFRIKKWAEMAGSDPSVFENLSIVDAVHWLEKRAEHPGALIKRFESDSKPGFHLFGRGLQRLTDYEETCSKDDVEPAVQCTDEKWLATQPPIAKIMCKCINEGMIPRPGSCPYMDTEGVESVQYMHQYEERKQASITIALFVVIPAVIVAIAIAFVIRARRRKVSSPLLTPVL